MNELWEATDAQAEVAMTVLEGDDWRKHHAESAADSRLEAMREVLSAAIGPDIDRLRDDLATVEAERVEARVRAAEERETVAKIEAAFDFAGAPRAYIPAWVAAVVKVVDAARAHDAAHGPWSHDPVTARALRDALAALHTVEADGGPPVLDEVKRALERFRRGCGCGCRCAEHLDLADAMKGIGL